MKDRKRSGTARRVPLFEDYSVEFLRWSSINHRPATRELHGYNVDTLMRFFSGQRLDQITPGAIEDFKARRSQEKRRGGGWISDETVSGVSVNRALTTMQALFALAIRSREYGPLDNPVRHVRRFRERGRMRVLTVDEEVRYFSAMVSPNLRDLARLLLDTAGRPGEILGLRPGDVDIARGLVHLASQDRSTGVIVVLGKTRGSERTVPLTRAAVQILRRRIEASGGGFVFPAARGKSYIKSLRRQHSTAVRRARVERFRLYDLRHTAATRLAERGVALPVLSALLGHSDPKMTYRYLHPQERALRSAVEMLEAS
jgi:integrase